MADDSSSSLILSVITLISFKIRQSSLWRGCIGPGLGVSSDKLSADLEVNLKILSKWRKKYSVYLGEYPFDIGGLTWLGWLEWGILEEWKLSSISRTFAKSDFDDISFCSISFIFFCIMIVFLVIFSPGRDILKNQGIHCRKIIWTFGEQVFFTCLSNFLTLSNSPTLASRECLRGGGDSSALG